MRWSKAVCKKCKVDILEDYSSYVSNTTLAELMKAHDQIVHSNSYEITPEER